MGIVVVQSCVCFLLKMQKFRNFLNNRKKFSIFVGSEQFLCIFAVNDKNGGIFV
jgi:hypothetical protein